MQGKVISHITKGLIIAAILVLVDIIARKAGPGTDYVAIRWVIIGIMIAGFIFSAWFYAYQMEGNITFGNAFAHGFRTAAVVIFLFALYTYIVIKFVDPPLSAKEIEDIAHEYQKQGNLMPSEAKEQAMLAAKNAWIGTVSAILFVGLLLGVIGSAAGAAIAKKNR